MSKMIDRVQTLMLVGGVLLTAPAGADAAPAPAAAAPVPAAPQAAAEGPRLTSQSFGSWVYRCQEAMADGKPGRSTCELAQDVVVQQEGKTQTVMTMIVSPTPDGNGHGFTARVPLGVRLKPGLSLAIDEGMPQTLGFDYCGPRGCWVAGTPIDGLIAGLKAGKTGRAKLVLLNGREVTIEFPLAGFSPGLAALDGSRTPVADAKPSDAKPGDAKAKPKAK